MDRINCSHNILIPKHQGAVDIGDFWPISLSNLMCLISAKLQANQLRDSIDALISPFQSAFIPGRQMAENGVLARETVATWNCRGATGFLWNVDFAKAYDSLNWRFLWIVLRRRGFPEEWIRWVRQCVTTHSFSLLVDGHLQGGRIHPQRGVQQGCPLAPLPNNSVVEGSCKVFR